MHIKEEAARIAFVGAGIHSTESLYPNIPMIPEFDLVAVCDLNEDRARRVAKRYGVPHYFTDVEVMLDKTELQGVCICGPPLMHYEVGIKVLERRIPIWIEKPPAPDLPKTKALADLARKRNTFGMVGFMKRFAPANLVAKEFMESGSFGKLSSITLIHGCGPYDDIRSMLNGNGIHMIDLLRFFAGDVESVYACAYNPSESIKAISASVKLLNGAVGQLNQNSGHTWSDCFEPDLYIWFRSGYLIDSSRTVEVMTERARFAKCEGLQLFGWSNRYYVSGNMAGWAAGGHYTRGYWGELNHFAKACLGKVEPVSTLEDGVEAMTMIEAIMISVNSGKPVSIKGLKTGTCG
ncbi:MAG: Gfo/Idh/MocA family oxidoreductase [Candidatus Methanomethyliaceae archaeon]